MWPFRRRAADGAPDHSDGEHTTAGSPSNPELPSTAVTNDTLPTTTAGGAWRDLAPIQRVSGDLQLVTATSGFAGSLVSLRSPGLLAPLGHHRTADAPNGLITVSALSADLGGATGQPASIPATPDAPVVRDFPPAMMSATTTSNIGPVPSPPTVSAPSTSSGPSGAAAPVQRAIADVPVSASSASSVASVVPTLAAAPAVPTSTVAVSAPIAPVLPVTPALVHEWTVEPQPTPASADEVRPAPDDVVRSTPAASTAALPVDADTFTGDSADSGRTGDGAASVQTLGADIAAASPSSAATSASSSAGPAQVDPSVLSASMPVVDSSASAIGDDRVGDTGAATPVAPTPATTVPRRGGLGLPISRWATDSAAPPEIAVPVQRRAGLGAPLASIPPVAPRPTVPTPVVEPQLADATPAVESAIAAPAGQPDVAAVVEVAAEHGSVEPSAVEPETRPLSGDETVQLSAADVAPSAGVVDAPPRHHEPADLLLPVRAGDEPGGAGEPSPMLQPLLGVVAAADERSGLAPTTLEAASVPSAATPTPVGGIEAEAVGAGPPPEPTGEELSAHAPLDSGSDGARAEPAQPVVMPLLDGGAPATDASTPPVVSTTAAAAMPLSPVSPVEPGERTVSAQMASVEVPSVPPTSSVSSATSATSASSPGDTAGQPGTVVPFHPIDLHGADEPSVAPSLQPTLGSPASATLRSADVPLTPEGQTIAATDLPLAAATGAADQRVGDGEADAIAVDLPTPDPGAMPTMTTVPTLGAPVSMSTPVDTSAWPPSAAPGRGADSPQVQTTSTSAAALVHTAPNPAWSPVAATRPGASPAAAAMPTGTRAGEPIQRLAVVQREDIGAPRGSSAGDVAVDSGLGRRDADGTVVFRLPEHGPASSTASTSDRSISVQAHAAGGSDAGGGGGDAWGGSDGGGGDDVSIQTISAVEAPAAAPAPGAGAAGAGGGVGDLDELARRLYPRLRLHLRHELRLDRERAGSLVESRR